MQYMRIWRTKVEDWTQWDLEAAITQLKLEMAYLGQRCSLVSSAIEHLPSMYENLGSISSIQK